MTDWLKEMVERISWFKPVDYEILMFFDAHDIIATAKVVSVNIGYDRQYVSKRLNALADAELLQNDDGVFSLTDFGREFLAGNIDASDLED